MTRTRLVIATVAVLALVPVVTGHALLLAYALAAASLAIVAGLVGWSAVTAIRDSDLALKGWHPFRRRRVSAPSEEQRHAA